MQSYQASCSPAIALIPKQNVENELKWQKVFFSSAKEI